MITNILIAGSFFIIGFTGGALFSAYKLGKAMVDVSKKYKEITGNDFIGWIKRKSAELQIAKLYEL